MNSMDTNIGTMIAVIFSIVSLLLSVIGTLQNRKNTIIETVTKNRINWITDVRAQMMRFIELYVNKESADALIEQKASIQLYMRSKVKSYNELVNAMDECCRCPYSQENLETLQKLINATQVVLAEVWKRIKDESGMTKWEDKKYAEASIMDDSTKKMPKR